ncbi:MAG: hypothetical protein ABIO85_02080 [Sphingomicrobium sp.]
MMMKRLALLGSAIAIVSACSKLPSDDANGSATTAPATTTPAAPATRTRGVLETVGADSLGIKTYDGKSVMVPIAADTKFAWVVASSLASLKSGDFVGTATTGPDDSLRAVELVIFPEAMRGSGEGHYGWDVPGVVASAGGSANGSSGMTNGTVQQSGMTNGTVQQQSGMTNGTVTGGTGKPGETTLTIGYKGGTAKVLVPVGTPIVRFEPTERSVLAKGQKLFVVEAPGAKGAKFVAVGKDGVMPPM